MTVEDPRTLALTPSTAASLTRGKVNRKEGLRDMYIESRSSEGWVIPGRRVQRYVCGGVCVCVESCVSNLLLWMVF